MNSIINKINNAFTKTVLITGIFVVSFLAADFALAGTPQLRVKNTTPGHEAYSAGSAFASSVRAEPGDTLEWQMFANFTAAAGMTIVLPSDLTYVTTTYSSPAATASANGQTISWTFASGSTEVIRFTTTVATGAALSTNHTLNVTYSTDTSITSDTATVQTGPVLKTITPSSGGDATANNITLTGHGFTQPSDITSIVLSPGNINIVPGDLTITGPDNGIYTITGARVNAGTAVGMYYIILTTTVSGTALATEANTSETVTFTVTDGTTPTMSSADSYVHSSGVLTLTFNETIDVSATDLSKITLYDASSGGTLSQVLTGATVSTADSTTVTITLTPSQKNAVSAAGVAASNLYVQITGSGIYDLSNNALATQGSRTAITAWTKDTVQPTAAIAYTQNSVTTTSVQAGDVTITATFSEPMAPTPKIAIDQPGATDIAAANMSLPAGGDGTIWTYTYAINADSDGAAAVTLSSAVDYANNALNTTTGDTFSIDRGGPSPAISTLATPTSSPTEISLTWTPTYTDADFSTYKIYYGTSAGVDSSNGTLISVGNSATNSYAASNLSSGTQYFFVMYICDQAGNCSGKSNEASRGTSTTGAIIQTSGGGGTTPSTPSTASSAGTITSSGGSITTTVSGGSSATVSVPANSFTTSSSVSVSEATSSEKNSAPIAGSDGAIVPNTVFNIQSGSTFSLPVTLEFAYNEADLASLDPSSLRIAYFDAPTSKWVPLASTINPTTRKITAQTTHFTLFAIVYFVGAPVTPQETPTTPPSEGGQVLGSSVGIYPNGTLLKAPNSSAVWHISGDKKHAIPSPAVLTSRFNWNDIVRLPSSRQLDLYEQGEDVKFAANTLVKEVGNNAVYRVSTTSGLQPILSMDVFLKRFYQQSEIVEVPAGALASYPREAYISDPSFIYSGELAAVPQKGVLSPVYYIDNGEAREFPNRDIFNSYALKLKRIRAITSKELKTFAIAKPMPYPDGALLKGSKSTVYVISNGKKQAFYSGLDFDALLYNRKRIKRVTDSILAGFENASQIRLVQRNIHTASN